MFEKVMEPKDFRELAVGDRLRLFRQYDSSVSCMTVKKVFPIREGDSLIQFDAHRDEDPEGSDVRMATVLDHPTLPPDFKPSVWTFLGRE